MNDFQAPQHPMGDHYIVELIGCNPDTLTHIESVEQIFMESAKRSKATILNSNFHQFEPQGVSGVVLIAESHFTIHTWPEKGYAAVDVFTCGDTMQPDVGIQYMKSQFAASDIRVKKIHRGY
jgi:S-adenosylmethionine decarboxylase